MAPGEVADSVVYASYLGFQSQGWAEAGGGSKLIGGGGGGTIAMAVRMESEDVPGQLTS